MPTFFQAGHITGLLQGVYEGDIDFKTLAQHGDTGLGTLNRVDGEMIALDGEFYRVDSAGVATRINPDALTPFSVVARFKPTISFPIKNISTLDELNNLLDKSIPTPNIFYMIRIDAELEWIKLRSESCQPNNKPLAETLPALQKIFELTNSKGSLIITRCPAYSAGFTVAGYHYHYINEARTTGGHVFDFRLKTGKVEIAVMRRFSVVLFNNTLFDEANLEIDVEAALKKTE